MKPGLFFTAALAMAVGPALAQEAPAPPPPPSAYTPPQYNELRDSPFRVEPTRVCVAVGAVKGANRVGQSTVYLQDHKGEVFRADLSEPCAALDAAQSISLRSHGLDVCPGGPAIMVVKTSAGTKRCAVREVARPSKAELIKLASAQR